MIHIDSIHTLGQSLHAARGQLGHTQAQLALAADVGLRFIVELEAGNPTLRLEHLLRVLNALSGELSLSRRSSAPTDPITARPSSDTDQLAATLSDIRPWTNWLPWPRPSRWDTTRRTQRQLLR